MASERRYGIGYALAPKKRNSFIQHSLVELARARGIDLICIDDSKPLVDQGPFDCVLHKLTGDEWRKQLEEYSSRYPNVSIIDRPEAIERLHNRISMLQVVSELRIREENDEDIEAETFGIPKQIVVYKAEALNDFKNFEGLKFPVIAKPLVADGSVKSHKMSLVFNSEGLLNIKPPLVLQEFVNHGGVIFKVYVVGDYVKCVKRKSLPDVPEDRLGSSQGSMSFCYVSNVTHDQKNEEYSEVMHLEEAVLPPGRLIGRIAEGLRKALGLYLFNFDVIRDTRAGNHYLVIDINYFPGYAKMPAYESVLTDFFWKMFHGELMLEGSAVEDSSLNYAQSFITRDEDGIEKSTDAEYSLAVTKEDRLGKEYDADDPSTREEDSLSATLANPENSSRETIATVVDTSRETLVSADNTLNDISEGVPQMNAAIPFDNKDG